ncbi:uncharacterized protein LOC132695677 isoform X2 [Cylas formicarius]|uniref:uncharacterized protein LOC132695677 isoform X2 n=1 Tax=Cylas formicarius TaxID=197179 RepID=UPI0029584BE3|nr:uncharacterized protein LOC132695677 isoform X2 [Cylas formicarius]
MRPCVIYFVATVAFVFGIPARSSANLFGCVKMKYLSQEEGVLVNVSYGESPLHSQQVKGSKPTATCLALLTNVAEMCARFPNLEPHDDGLKGCLLLEPKLLGAVTSHFKIGCFTMGPRGMALDKTNDTAPAESIPVIAATNVTQNQSDSIISGDLLAIVNETAEQGLAFISNLLGLSFSDDASDVNPQSSSAPANPPSELPHTKKDSTT